MRASIIVVASLGLLWASALAQAPHQHGHSKLKMAIEGKRIVVEWTAPGDDIVGFEHPAQTPAEQQTLERAMATLKDPLSLIALPAAARCKVTDATVQEEGLAPLPPGAPPPAAGGHAEFEAAYEFVCDDVGAIRIIEFPLFTKFPRAAELEVTLVTNHNQTAYDVDRDKPRLDRGNAFWRWLTGR